MIASFNPAYKLRWQSTEDSHIVILMRFL